MDQRIFSRYDGDDNEQKARRLLAAIREADAVVIGAGSGLSTSAGFTYAGERFARYFGDFAQKYGIQDMYSGGFYPFVTKEEKWAWWSRNIWFNRYIKAPEPVYEDLLRLVEDKDYFVITTNVDHQFQMAGFDKKRLFCTQGDYGLFQCSEPCHQKTYDNKETVAKMLISQGFIERGDGTMAVPEGAHLKMEIDTDLIPYCPRCHEEMAMNLRCDTSFVEDRGWHAASLGYQDFIRRHKDLKAVYLELGVGLNTPVWIKYPFWEYTYKNGAATYACLNLGESYVPEEIATRSICIDGDIGATLKMILHDR